MAKKAAGRKHGQKIGASVTIDPDLYAWAKEHTGAGHQFANLSHAVERGLLLLKEHEEGKWVKAHDKK